MILTEILKKNKSQIGSVFPFNLNKIPTVVSDCSKSNADLSAVDYKNAKEYYDYAQQFLKGENAVAGVGGYLEERIIYEGRDLFEKEKEPRNIHLGIDVSLKAGTPLIAPLDGIVHSFADNKGLGDYGPTIVLEHEMEGYSFFTLYGHLSRTSLTDKSVGQKLSKGTEFASLGNMEENGQWPPHLHFQLITDMRDYQGDFPGVCSKSRLEEFKVLCPNPNYILQIDKLPM